MRKHLKAIKGFTLIELLVVIAIIAILTGVIVTNITSSRAKARDAKRIADLGQLQLALNLYYDKCKQYPLPADSSHNIQRVAAVDPDQDNCITGVTADIRDYISTIPKPPSSPLNQSQYDYAVDSTTVPRDYVLHIQLEQPSEIVKDGREGNGINGIPVCDHSTHYCIGPR